MHFQNEVDQMEQWSFSNAFGEIAEEFWMDK